MENSKVRRLLAVLACLWWGSVAYADQNSIVIPETGAAWDAAHPTVPATPHTFENTAKFFINPTLKSITSNFSGSGCGGITSPVPWQWCVDTIGRQVYMNTAPVAGTPFSFTPVFTINPTGQLTSILQAPTSISLGGVYSDFADIGQVQTGIDTSGRPAFGNASHAVNVKDFGAKCDGATDDHVALQAALTTAIAQTRPLYIPGAYCANSASLTFNSSVDVFGDGPQTSVILMTANVPAFVWTNSITAQYFNWHDFTITAPAASTGPAILIQGGTGSTFWARGQFRNINIFGFLYGIEANNSTAGNWNIFDAVNCGDSVTIQTQYCIYNPQGSGTGNVYTRLQPNMFRSGASVLRFEGTGKNVGDIIVSDSHFCCNGSILSIGAGTTYRSKITISSSQYDAGVLKAFDLDTTGISYQDLRLIGNNSGGATVPGISPNTASAVIDNMGVNVRRAGTVGFSTGSGTFSNPIFSVAFPSGAIFTGTSCKLTITGLIGNVGAGVTTAEFSVLDNNGTSSVVAGTTAKTPASAWSVSTTISGTTVTFNADITETASSSFDGQISCTGGTFNLNRL